MNHKHGRRDSRGWSLTFITALLGITLVIVPAGCAVPTEIPSGDPPTSDVPSPESLRSDKSSPESSLAPTTTAALIEVSSPTAFITVIPNVTGQATILPVDLVIGPEQFGQLVKVSVGHRIRIESPVNAGEWQVEYDTSLLKVLAPETEMSMLSPQGWSFEALASGRTDIMMTSVAPPCDQSAPCPPTVARLTVTVEIQP